MRIQLTYPVPIPMGNWRENRVRTRMGTGFVIFQKRTACQDQPWILRASALTLAVGVGGVVVECGSEDIREKEEREEEKREGEKEGLAGWTGLKGVWLYEGLCFKGKEVLEKEQQRFTVGRSLIRSLPSLPENDRRVLAASVTPCDWLRGHFDVLPRIQASAKSGTAESHIPSRRCWLGGRCPHLLPPSNRCSVLFFV